MSTYEIDTIASQLGLHQQEVEDFLHEVAALAADGLTPEQAERIIDPGRAGVDLPRTLSEPETPMERAVLLAWEHGKAHGARRMLQYVAKGKNGWKAATWLLENCFGYATQKDQAEGVLLEELTTALALARGE